MIGKYTKLDVISRLLLEVDSAIDNVETLLFQCEGISNSYPTVQMFRYMTVLQSMLLANKINNLIYFIEVHGVEEWIDKSVPFDEEEYNEEVDVKIPKLLNCEIDPFANRTRDSVTGNWFNDNEKLYFDVYSPSELNDIARLWHDIAVDF